MSLDLIGQEPSLEDAKEFVTIMVDKLCDDFRADPKKETHDLMVKGVMAHRAIEKELERED